MKKIQRYGCFIGFLLLTFTAACAPIKPLDAWKDAEYTQPLGKVLVVAVARENYIREQFERILSARLNSRGIEALPSYTVLPQSGEKLDRAAVVAKVKELGIENVLVARSIDKESVVNLQQQRVFFSATSSFSDGWYTYYTGSLVYPAREYTTDYFTIATTLFDVNSNNPVWSYLSQVKVKGSNQEAVNLLIPTIMQHLEDAQFF